MTAVVSTKTSIDSSLPSEQPSTASANASRDVEIARIEDSELSHSERTISLRSNESTVPKVQSSERRAFITRLVVGSLLLALIAFVIVDTATDGHVKDAVNVFLGWVEENPVPGIFLFVVVYFVATVLFIPGSVLTLGAGFVFSSAFGLGGGVALGTLSAFLGASLGALVAFLLGRYLLRDQAYKLTLKYAAFEALDAALQENGLKIFILLRLSPIIPFNAINYVGGVTSVSFVHYALALFAIIPGTVFYVYLGASAGSLSDSESRGDNMTVTLIVVCVGVLFGFLAVWVTSKIARRELDRIVEERRGETTDGGNASEVGTQE